MEYYEALQAKALLAVLRPDDAAHMRTVMRFYSKHFHVPLPEVEALPETHVLQAYYEEVFSQMDEGERLEYLDILTETPEERAARKNADKKGATLDDDFAEKLNAEVKSGMLRGPPKGKKVGPPVQVLEAIKQAQKRADALTEPPPPDIKMDFGGGGNLLQEVGDLDPLAPLPSKVK